MLCSDRHSCIFFSPKLTISGKAKPQTSLKDQKKGCGQYFTTCNLTFMGNCTFPVHCTLLQNSHASLQRLLNINLLRSMLSVRVKKTNGNNADVKVFTDLLKLRIQDVKKISMVSQYHTVC